MNITNPIRQRRKKKAFPVSTICRNCGTQQISRYCHNCGQDLFSGSERSLKEITNSFMDTVLAWDNKLIITLRYLIFYPGKLTREFFSGKIASYVFPAKLFWFMSILFFATISLDAEIELDTSDINKIIETVQGNISSETLEVEDKKKVSKEIKEILDDHIKGKESGELFMNYAPYAMFLLIPFFALLVQMFYFRKCRYYASQMIFSLHFHTFVFMAFAIFNLIILFSPTFEDSEILIYLYFFVPLIYFIISLFVVYRPKKRHLLWKIPLIMLLYVIALLAVVVLLGLLIGVLTYGIEFVGEIFD